MKRKKEKAHAASFDPVLTYILGFKKLPLDGDPSSRAEGREWLLMLARQLRKDTLSDVGRDYLADALERIADGEAIDFLLPRERTQEIPPEKIFEMVEIERHRRGSAHGDMKDIFAAVGRKVNLKASTVEKQTSRARSELRKGLQFWIDQGFERDEWLRRESSRTAITFEQYDKIFFDIR